MCNSWCVTIPLLITHIDKLLQISTFDSELSMGLQWGLTGFGQLECTGWWAQLCLSAQFQRSMSVSLILCKYVYHSSFNQMKCFVWRNPSNLGQIMSRKVEFCSPNHLIKHYICDEANFQVIYVYITLP